MVNGKGEGGGGQGTHGPPQAMPLGWEVEFPSGRNQKSRAKKIRNIA